jgi:hypothetical protein
MLALILNKQNEHKMKRYFYSNGQEKGGPVTLEELKQKNIQPKTLIWHEGLDDWKEAESIEELREIFELSPPPIIHENDTIGKQNIAENIEPRNSSLPLELKVASQGWIVAGFIFAMLGGWLGAAIGLNYAFGNYKKETKRLGWAIAILGIFSMVIWRSIK